MINNSRAITALYSDPECPFCHRTRIVMYEKNVSADIEHIKNGDWPENIAAINRYGTNPVLVDRDLVLFNTDIIISYLDERFLQPPLMPADPASKAQMRLMLYRIDKDWYSLWPALVGEEKSSMNKARKTIQEDLVVLSPLFAKSAFFMGNNFSLLDCSLAPLLWRLPFLGIKLPAKAKVIEDYGQRIFARDSFQASLSEIEREMR